jgi:hypothetical protein
MAASKKEELKNELSVALDEIGDIKPWFDKEVKAWVFEHDLYPVRYAGETSREVIKNYPKYLEIFIDHRMRGRIDEVNEKATRGRGGIRPGAGRPKGTFKEPTKQTRLPSDIVDWLKMPGVISHIREMIKAYEEIDTQISKRKAA